MIGNNNFNFEKEAFGAFALGLDAVDPVATSGPTSRTGSFNDVAAATEAFNNLKAKGVGAIYPYLGGSHEAVVKLVQRERHHHDERRRRRTPASAPTSSTTSPVMFDAGDYLSAILAGDPVRQARSAARPASFHVGVDPQVGRRDLQADARADRGDGAGLRRTSPPASSTTSSQAIKKEAYRF